MIEVNLLPGGKKGGGGGPSFSFDALQLPDFSGLPMDRWVLGSSAVVLVLALVAGYFYLDLGGTYEETQVAVEEAARDSAQYADLIEQAEDLRARRDSIAERVAIIQEIDQDRYTWPHLMDEVARALPEFTWLTNLTQVSMGQELQFRLQGMAGNNFALTRFMENLEGSPFVRGVTLISSELSVVSQGNVSRSVNQFTLEASYQDPPSDLLETVPLFEGGSPSQTSSQ